MEQRRYSENVPIIKPVYENEFEIDDEYSRLSDIWAYPIETVSNQVSLFKNLNDSQKLSSIQLKKAIYMHSKNLNSCKTSDTIDKQDINYYSQNNTSYEGRQLSHEQVNTQQPSSNEISFHDSIEQQLNIEVETNIVESHSEVNRDINSSPAIERNENNNTVTLERDNNNNEQNQEINSDILNIVNNLENNTEIDPNIINSSSIDTQNIHMNEEINQLPQTEINKEDILNQSNQINESNPLEQNKESNNDKLSINTSSSQINNVQDVYENDLEDFISEFSRRCQMYPGRKPLIGNPENYSTTKFKTNGEQINQIMAISLEKLVQQPRGTTTLPLELSQALVSGTMKSLQQIMKRSLSNTTNAWLQLYSSIDIHDKEKKLNILETFLKGSPLFKRFNYNQIVKFCKYFQPLNFIEDSIIVEENESCSSFYLIIEGYIKKYIYDSSKQTNIFVGILESGDGFCFDSLLRISPSSNTYRGASEGLILKLSRSDFIKVLAESDSFNHEIEIDIEKIYPNLTAYTRLLSDIFHNSVNEQQEFFYQLLFSIFDKINTIPAIDMFLKTIISYYSLTGITIFTYNSYQKKLVNSHSYGAEQNSELAEQCMKENQTCQSIQKVILNGKEVNVPSIALPLMDANVNIYGVLQIAYREIDTDFKFGNEDIQSFKFICNIYSSFLDIFDRPKCIFTNSYDNYQGISFQLKKFLYNQSNESVINQSISKQRHILFKFDIRTHMISRENQPLQLNLNCEKTGDEYILPTSAIYKMNTFDSKPHTLNPHSYIYVEVNIDNTVYYGSVPLFDEMGYLKTGLFNIPLLSNQYYNEKIPSTWFYSKQYGSLQIMISMYTSPIKYGYDEPRLLPIIIYPSISNPFSERKSLSECLCESMCNKVFECFKPKEYLENNEVNSKIIIQSILSTPLTHSLSYQKQQLLKFFISKAMKLNLGLFRISECIDYINIKETNEIYKYINQWPLVSFEEAILCLSYRVADPLIRFKAVVSLYNTSEDDLQLYLLQLVEALKYEQEINSPLCRFLIYKSLQYPTTIGYSLFWHLKSQLYNSKTQSIYSILLKLYITYCENFTDSIGNEYYIVTKLLEIAQKVRLEDDPQKRQILLKSSLEFLNLPVVFTLPISNGKKLCSINIEHCKVMKSKKRPLFLEFVKGNENNSDWIFGNKREKQEKTLKILVKSGDDLRQDQVVLQVFKVFEKIWKQDNIDVIMAIYNCIPTGYEEGLLEIVQDSQTIGGIYRESRNERLKIDKNDKKTSIWLKKLKSAERVLNDNVCVLEWLIGITSEGHTDSLIQERKQREEQLQLGAIKMPEYLSINDSYYKNTFSEAAENFARSCAPYCIATYVLGIGDRHNDNIMIKTNGIFFHIDFGHILGHFKQKFGIKREKSPFIFTESFASVLGPPQHPLYQLFVSLCCQCYLSLRKHSTLLYALFELLYDSDFPEINSEKDIQFMMNRLHLEKTEAEATDHIIKEINISLKCKMTLVNDAFHVLKN